MKAQGDFLDNSKIMWKKLLIIFFSFYIFALLQNSFLTYFNFFGAVPNLVFILFFLLAYFEKGDNYQIIFLALIAGAFLDIFSYSYLGPSIVSLMIVGFLLKKSQALLKNREDNYPFFYFLPLFAIFLLVYNLFLSLCLHFFDPSRLAVNFGFGDVFMIIYNMVLASAAFYIYKKCQRFIKSKK